MICWGNVLGYALGSVRLSRWLPLFASDLQALFTCAAVIMLGTVALSLQVPDAKPSAHPPRTESTSAIAADTPIVTSPRRRARDPQPSATEAFVRVDEEFGANEDEDEETDALLGLPLTGTSGSRTSAEPTEVASVLAQISAFPVPLRLVWAVQTLVFFAWFVVFMFMVSWVAIDVFTGTPAVGSPRYAQYQAGVRAGNTGMMLQSIVAGGVSLLLPWAVTVVGFKVTWALPTVLMATCLMCTHLASSPTAAVALVTGLGPAWATTLVVPWALVSMAATDMAKRSDSAGAGLLLGVMNIAQCLPEIIASLLSVALFSGGEGGDAGDGHRTGLLFSLGGLSCLAAVALMQLTPFLDIAGVADVERKRST